jgi:hypothetical protein
MACSPPGDVLIALRIFFLFLWRTWALMACVVFFCEKVIRFSFQQEARVLIWRNESIVLRLRQLCLILKE